MKNHILSVTITLLAFILVLSFVLYKNNTDTPLGISPKLKQPSKSLNTKQFKPINKKEDIPNKESSVSVLEINNLHHEDSNIFWSATHEIGDLREWHFNQGNNFWDSLNGTLKSENGEGLRVYGESFFNTADCEQSISNKYAHTGNKSLELKMGSTAGQKNACRTFKRYIEVVDYEFIELPKEAFYSTWFYFPNDFKTDVWWDIFQFKTRGTSSEPKFSLNVSSDGKGSRFLYGYEKYNDASRSRVIPSIKNKNIPINEWFHVEVFLKQNTRLQNPDGEFKVWVDGEKIIDQENIETLRNVGDQLQWSVDNYTDNVYRLNSAGNVVGTDPTIYVDDAVISKVKIGTSFDHIGNLNDFMAQSSKRTTSSQ